MARSPPQCSARPPDKMPTCILDSSVDMQLALWLGVCMANSFSYAHGFETEACLKPVFLYLLWVVLVVEIHEFPTIAPLTAPCLASLSMPGRQALTRRCRPCRTRRRSFTGVFSNYGEPTLCCLQVLAPSRTSSGLCCPFRAAGSTSLTSEFRRQYFPVFPRRCFLV